jgi:sn1-specific diacylglycerol lipase
MLHKASKSICISIRGTVGLTDLITDLLSNPIDISEQSVLGTQLVQDLGLDEEESTKDRGLYAHTGIVSSAKCILQDLEQKGILDALSTTRGIVCKEIDPRWSSENHVEYLSQLDEEDEVVLSCERANAIIKNLLAKGGWKIVVTGHSLGAAVASLVSFRVLETCPDIECFVFNPPGGLFDSKLAKLSKKFCTSVIVGQDAISRLSLLTVKRLIDDMMLTLALCKRPKLSVLLDSIIGRYDDPSVSNTLFVTSDGMSEEVSSILKQYVMSSNLHKKGVDYRPLYPPGNLLFLRPFGNLEKTDKRNVPCCPGGSRKHYKKIEVWDAVWIEAEHLMDEGILLSHSMVRHHQLVTVATALNCSLEHAQERQSSPGSSV